eukprot:scaffold12.g8242.t1
MAERGPPVASPQPPIAVPALNAEQEAAARAPLAEPLMLLASAGTGKMTYLVARVLHMLERGVPPEQILYVTFTRRVLVSCPGGCCKRAYHERMAEEARARLAAAGPPGAQRVVCSTVHAFCYRLLRNYWRVAGFPRCPTPLTSKPEQLRLVTECIAWLRAERRLEQAALAAEAAARKSRQKRKGAEAYEAEGHVQGGQQHGQQHGQEQRSQAQGDHRGGQQGSSPPKVARPTKAAASPGKQARKLKQQQQQPVRRFIEEQKRRGHAPADFAASHDVAEKSNPKDPLLRGAMCWQHMAPLWGKPVSGLCSASRGSATAKIVSSSQVLLAYLRALLNPGADEAFRTLLNCPPRKLGPAAEAALLQHQQGQRLRGLPPALLDCARRLVADGGGGLRSPSKAPARAEAPGGRAGALRALIRPQRASLAALIATLDALQAEMHTSELEPLLDSVLSTSGLWAHLSEARAKARAAAAAGGRGAGRGGGGGQRPGRRDRRGGQGRLAAKYYGPMRALLRAAASFSASWEPDVEFVQDASFEAGRGPPSLARACLLALHACRAGREAVQRLLARARRDEVRAPLAAEPAGGRERVARVLALMRRGEASPAAALVGEEEKEEVVEEPLPPPQQPGQQARPAASGPPLPRSAAQLHALRAAGAAARRGPHVLGDFLASLLTEGEERSALERGVVLSTIHAAKGLEASRAMGRGPERRPPQRLGGVVVPEQDEATEHYAEERRLAHVATMRARRRLCLTWHLRALSQDGTLQRTQRSSILDPVWDRLRGAPAVEVVQDAAEGEAGVSPGAASASARALRIPRLRAFVAPRRAAPRQQGRPAAASAIAAPPRPAVGRYSDPQSAAGNVVVEVVRNKAAAAAFLCGVVEAVAARAVAERGMFTLAVPGGSVLKALRGLAGSKVPWDKTRLFFVNHKAVPADDAGASSYAKARALFLDAVGAPPGAAAGPGGSADAEAEAAAYEAALRRTADELGMERAPGPGAPPRFDLLLLGVGSDGHVGSLYPGGAATLDASGAWVLPVAKAKPPASFTLSLGVMNAARVVVVCLTGAGKAAAARTALETRVPAGDFPAQLVRPDLRPAVWLLDEAAAAQLALVHGDAAAAAAAPAAAGAGAAPAGDAAPDAPAGDAAPDAPDTVAPPAPDPSAGQTLPDGSILYQF